jgi:hypothetical protein
MKKYSLVLVILSIVVASLVFVMALFLSGILDYLDGDAIGTPIYDNKIINENNRESESNVKYGDKLSTITESFKEKYDAVVEGTVLSCMGHKSYPVKYQCDVQVEQYIKFDGKKTPQLTILGYRETFTDNGLKAIFGLDYHDDENYYEIMERVLLDNEN